jgi:hypothetical protein
MQPEAANCPRQIVSTGPSAFLVPAPSTCSSNNVVFLCTTASGVGTKLHLKLRRGGAARLSVASPAAGKVGEAAWPRYGREAGHSFRAGKTQAKAANQS